MPYKFANSTCAVRHESGVVRLHLGDPWHAADPFVKARPDLFNDDPPSDTIRGAAPVEDASARPGEKRGVRAR